MKNYTITVNGTAYAVTVEESGAPAPLSAAPAPKAPVLSAPPAPSAPGAASSPLGAAGAVQVSAPMPGKVVAVKSAVGQAVKKGDVILVLEAMKMENEIVAPQDGVIAGIHAQAGDSVDSGAVLATLN